MELLQIYHPQIPEFLSRLSLTDEMLRLKGVGMDCGCEYTGYPAYRDCPPASRYEHSLGVALIIWHFTRSAEQSIAGLFHDISTPAFSHTVDFLNRDYMQQESTEAGTREIISRSVQICALLKEYGVAAESVWDYHRYPIADNDSPRLSADRLEYTLRNFVRYDRKTPEEIRRFYGDLTVCKNEDGQEELMFLHPDIAVEFTRLALKASLLYISDSDRYSMQCLADLLQDALSARILTREDLHTTESAVIGKLLSRPETAAAWNRFRRLSEIRSRKDLPNEPGWFRVPAKKRYVDPMVCGRGRASALSESLRKEIRDFMAIDYDSWLRGD